MGTLLVLDSNTLGLVTNPNKVAEAERCRQWLLELGAYGVRAAIPETAYLEVLQGLRYARSRDGVISLTVISNGLEHIATTPAILKEARQIQDYLISIGRTPGPPSDLSPDCIVAASAKLAYHMLQANGPDTRAIVVTDNIKHFEQVVECYRWTDLSVSKLYALDNSHEPWYPPQREVTQPKEAKLLLDQGMEAPAFVDGLPRFNVLPIEKVTEVAGKTLNGSELIGIARHCACDAVITTNWNAVDEADRAASSGGRPVYLLALNGRAMQNVEALNKAMPDIEREIARGIKESREPSRGLGY